MVQWQLCTLEHLMNSGYGRPFPRHGLPLLFWFANNCVTFEPVNFVLVMKLVSDCQPEKGSYGFHWFSNAEQLLPVINRPRRSSSRKQTMYFEVGNLNTETYPGSADLPTYVMEHYGTAGKRGVYNIDRIIIGYQVKSRVVESVYVTEHSRSVSGRFSLESTYQVSAELIQALQSPQLDVTGFLTLMGFYGQIIYTHQSLNRGDPAAQQTLQSYGGSTAATDPNYDFLQQVGGNISAFSYNQNCTARYHSDLQAVCRLSARYPLCGWYDPWEGLDVEAKKKKKGGGGFSLIKLLLGAGVLYLAFRCFSWLRSWGRVSSDVLTVIPWGSPGYKQTDVMLDYIY